MGLLLRSVRVFRQFTWLEVGSGKVALSRPAHPRVTLTVRWLISHSRGLLKGFELQVLLTNGGQYGSLDLYDELVT